jgi:quercetin dioxygenase-like cupin family protein
MEACMNRTSRTGRYGQLLIVLVLIASPVWVSSARRSATTAPQAANQGISNFTGKVTSMDASDVRGVRFRYEAGARSHWHVHDGALVVLVEQGRGRIQLQGQKIQDLVPGQPVLLPGGIPHWHGAAPDQGLTWVAMTIGRDVKWMAPVSDEEYLGKK